MPTLRQECKLRRERLFETIEDNSIVILAANNEITRNADTAYPFRQSSDFYYLTGFVEPEAYAIFIKSRKGNKYILFNRERDTTQEIWVGKRAGQKGACDLFDADESFPVSQSDSLIPDLILGKKYLYFDVGHDPGFDQKAISWLRVAQSKIRTGTNAPDEIIHIGKILHEWRLIKSPFEIKTIKKAISIGAAAHIRAIHSCRPGLFEYNLEAEIIYEYLNRGSRMVAFDPIIASGSNACTLHYVRNDAMLKDGELVLMDCGADYEYYSSDITRTIPVGKKFSPAQKAIYQAVLDTQLAVIKIIKPGIQWNELQQKSEKIISEKLLELGILKGNLDEIISKQTFKQFYMHRIGHWLGIDTHDSGKYSLNDKWRVLEPNMIFTVEPGIYIPGGIKNVDKKWWNIGIRIEDDVLVTEKGCEILTSSVPKSIEAIEALRSNAF